MFFSPGCLSKIERVDCYFLVERMVLAKLSIEFCDLSSEFWEGQYKRLCRIFEKSQNRLWHSSRSLGAE